MSGSPARLQVLRAVADMILMPKASDQDKGESKTKRTRYP